MEYSVLVSPLHQALEKSPDGTEKDIESTNKNNLGELLGKKQDKSFNRLK